MSLVQRQRLRRAHRRFALRLVACFLLSTAALAAFNIVMNPFGIWPNFFGRPLNPRMTARIDSVRMVRAYDLLNRSPDAKEKRFRPPDALITGMSSVAWGIDPATYPHEDKVLYNCGLPGSSTEEQYHYVKLSLDQAPSIKKVYVDLNFVAFNDKAKYAPDFAFERMGATIPTFKDFVFTALTRYALVHSIHAWRRNRSGIVRHMVHDNGDGFHNYPEAGPETYKKNMEWRLAIHPLRPLHGGEIVQDQVDYLKKIVDLCKSRGVEVVLYFAPMHVWVFEQERYTGTFHLLTDLRRRVAAIHPYWDFGLCNEINGESIEAMRYFIDTIHYRPRTGTIVLAILNGKRPPGVSETFGVKVDNTNVEEHVRRFRRSVEQWRRDNPEEALLVQAHFDEQFKKMLPKATIDALTPTSLFRDADEVRVPLLHDRRARLEALPVGRRR